jgi:hypothetical protein
MKSRIVPFVPALALFAFALHGQTSNARLEGTVQDSSGAVIPGAKVNAVNIKTQTGSAVVSDAVGLYVITPLQPGTYRLTVDAGGFRAAVVNDIELTVGAIMNQVVTLEVGQLAEAVEVQANAVSVQATDAQIARAINIKDIDTLPQLGRTPITLAVFQPGVQIDIRAGQDSSFSRINGTRQGSNNNKLDGIDINDSVVPRLGLSLTANNTDSIGEFRVVTGGGKAEYGRNAGGQVELITRSGSNAFHGNAFDYLRNTDLNANDFFNNQSGGAVPKFIQNIYGGSFGGPILKNRTFIFGNFQGRRTRQEVVRNRTVPTDTAKQGIYRWPGGAYDFAAADPRGLGVDKEVAKILAQYPSPNNSDLGDGFNTAGYRFNNPVVGLEDQFTIRGDHRLSDNHVVFMRWSWQRNNSTDNLNNADATFPGQAQGSQGGHRWGYAIGSDWTFTTSMANEFRFGHQSASVDFLRPGRPAGPAYVTNLFTDVQNAAFGQGRNSPVNEITDNLTKIWGKHTVKIGGNIRMTTQYGYNYQGVYPNVSTTTGNGNSVPVSIGPPSLTSSQRSVFEQLYNDILGRMDSVTQTYYSDLQTWQPAGDPRVRNFKFIEQGYFFQDDWHATRRLTINIGLRWEYFGLPHETGGLQGAPIQASLINSVNQLNNITYARTDAYYAKDWNNLAPRFGFAYDLTGDGKTAIRGSFGVFYDRQIGATISAADGGTPGFSQQSVAFPNQAGADRRVADGVPVPPQPATPVLTLPVTRAFSATVFNPNLRNGYVPSYSLNIQREISRNTVIEAGYVGNRGVKLFYNEDVNQPRIYGDFLTSFRQIQAFIGSGAAVPSSNTFVRLYGTPQAAISALGATNFTQGRVGTVASSLDRTSSNYSRYPGAGLTDFYVRNYPQFNQVIYGTNDGRSYYDSFQASIRRTAGALKMAANYTFSKTIDNISADGNGFTNSTIGTSIPIDTYNLRLNRALADFDRRHSFNASAIYALPFGKGQRYGAGMPAVFDMIAGGWEIGSLWIWQAGQPFSVSSQRTTTAVSGNTAPTNTYAQYNATDTSIGSIDKRSGGVFYFSPDEVAQFTYPAAGTIGNSGRNIFFNPSFFEIDASVVKRFRIGERQSIQFRAEAYNLTNHTNFGLSSTNLNINTPATFGRFSQTVGTQTSSSSARTMQLVLRYDF